MKLFIPSLTTKLKLASDWTFNLYREYRNDSLINHFSSAGYLNFPKVALITLVKDTVLSVDRIYIRKGQDDYDSVTFTIADSPDKGLVTKSKGGTAPKIVRFWVKLDDANTLEFELV